MQIGECLALVRRSLVFSLTISVLALNVGCSDSEPSPAKKQADVQAYKEKMGELKARRRQICEWDTKSESLAVIPGGALRASLGV